MKLFLNVFSEFIEFSDKYIYHKKAHTYHLLCKRLEGYDSASKTHVRDRTFKLSPIYASVIYQIP